MKQPYPYLFFKMKFLSKIFFFYFFLGISSSVFADNAKTGMSLFESAKYEQAMTYFLKIIYVVILMLAHSISMPKSRNRLIAAGSS